MAKKTFRDALAVLGDVKPFGEPGAGEMLITPTIDQVHPDPGQPRHLLPQDLRTELLEGETTPDQVIIALWERCLLSRLYKRMRSGKISPAQALASQREKGVRDWTVQLLLEDLVELADSIKLVGLEQPITVYETGEGRYQIAVGERRWWAHVHLWYLSSWVEARNILARLRPPPGDNMATLARQHAENVVRTDLSALARARAIKRFRQAVEAGISGTTGSPNSAEEQASGKAATGGRGRPRDVAAARSHELDELTGARMEELTGRGMSGRMVRNYLALLTLPEEAQELAEAAALSERALRDVVSVPSPQQQIRMVRALAGADALGTGAGRRQEGAAEAKLPQPSAGRRAFSQFRASLRFAAHELPDPTLVAGEIAHMSAKKRAELLGRAQRYAEFVEAILKAVGGPPGEV